MKRLAMVAALGVVLVVVITRTPHDDGPAPGSWVGKTSQGESISFFVEDVDDDGRLVGGLVVGAVLDCERSGETLNFIMLIDAEVPVRDDRFVLRLESNFAWLRWSGTFGDVAHARGHLTLVLPVLTGHVLEKLGADKCEAINIAWTARPGEAEETRPDRPADLVVRFARDRDGRWTTQLSRAPE